MDDEIPAADFSSVRIQQSRRKLGFWLSRKSKFEILFEHFFSIYHCIPYFYMKETHWSEIMLLVNQAPGFPLKVIYDQPSREMAC